MRARLLVLLVALLALLGCSPTVAPTADERLATAVADIRSAAEWGDHELVADRVDELRAEVLAALQAGEIEADRAEAILAATDRLLTSLVLADLDEVEAADAAAEEEVADDEGLTEGPPSDLGTETAAQVAPAPAPRAPAPAPRAPAPTAQSSGGSGTAAAAPAAPKEPAARAAEPSARPSAAPEPVSEEPSPAAEAEKEKDSGPPAHARSGGQSADDVAVPPGRAGGRSGKDGDG